MKEIKYVLLLISHPTYKPTDTEAKDFLYEKLPELHECKAQIASYKINEKITPVTTRNIAIEIFGKEVANDSLFTYRTISFTISSGEGRIFVVYKKKNMKKIPGFLNAIFGRN